MQGRVELAITHWERKDTMALPEEATTEQIKKAVEKQKEDERSRQEQLEALTLRNEYEAGVMREQQWEAAMTQLQQAKEKMMKEHQESMQKIKEMAEQASTLESTEIQNWLKAQLEKQKPDAKEQEEAKRKEEKQLKIQELQQQQLEISNKLQELMGTEPTEATGGTDPVQQFLAQGSTVTNQAALLQQLRASLGKTEGDPNKTLLRAMITSNNKTLTPQGASTLKPEVITRLLSENPEGDRTMAEWLASLNKQDEGESQFTLHRNNYNREDERDPEVGERGTKLRSGMLEKAVTNIKRKEVWPQQNLGEDWAEDQIEFKHIKFEHLVAGECRTIQTCKEPAQILGRLKLLRRIAYLKLRGFEWYMLR